MAVKTEAQNKNIHSKYEGKAVIRGEEKRKCVRCVLVCNLIRIVHINCIYFPQCTLYQQYVINIYVYVCIYTYTHIYICINTRIYIFLDVPFIFFEFMCSVSDSEVAEAFNAAEVKNKRKTVFQKLLQSKVLH